jgi:hypothetical protein
MVNSMALNCFRQKLVSDPRPVRLGVNARERDQRTWVDPSTAGRPMRNLYSPSSPEYLPSRPCFNIALADMLPLWCRMQSAQL